MKTPALLPQEYSAKLVWFRSGPAWTCQKFGRHVITIHHGDTLHSKTEAVTTAVYLNSISPEHVTVAA